MRRLFIERAEQFFRQTYGSLPTHRPTVKLIELLEKHNVLKSKVVRLLPQGDLLQLAAHPCFIPAKELHKATERLSAFKRLRAHLDIEEVKVCAVCPRSSACPLKDKVPTQKVTSSRDALLLVYSIMKYGQFTDTQRQEQQGLSEAEQIMQKERARQAEGSSPEDGMAKNQDPAMTDEEELWVYLSALRVLDALPLIVATTVESREALIDMLEHNIAEYTVKKKVDSILKANQEPPPLPNMSKEKVKRDARKGLGELLDVASRSMQSFEKEVLPSK